MTDKPKPIRITVRDEPYALINGKDALVKKKTKAPDRLFIVTRKAGGRGRYTQTPVEMTIPAFRKLLVEQD